ncbi:MAG TPA: UDP-N-acetylmuramoyl-L-alanyl-D-glutamate--2,6-diaminopimelate ligase [Rectinemataceae bacterium]|nr:UDP-N-acetylmuramoyl-L-alanyl-D-glutamate--2,6-diaminopimelate ligase [Rectinemataceae bacterium]
MSRRLSSLVARLAALESSGDPDTEIRGLAYDSRAVKPGYLFFALPGIHDDGERWIAAAVDSGACAIIHRNGIADKRPGVAYIRVADPRAAMSPVADAFYASPSRDLTVIGVTGTEGKSTTVYLIWQLLNLAGYKAGFFSTVMSDSGAGELPNPEHQTTPEATAVQRMLASMRDAGMDFAVVEASSHGLSPRTSRLADVAFDAGVFMNVRHEHLEFHGSWEQYRHDKANLFRALDAVAHDKIRGGRRIAVPAFGVACADDPSAAYFAKATEHRTLTFSSKGAEADFLAQSIESDAAGNSFLLRSPEGSYEARIELPGAFNVDNCLAAVATVSESAGLPVSVLVPLLPRLRPVLGRMTGVDLGQPFEVIVDYAHTPSSFEAILPPLRLRARGRLIVLFGSAGERDRAKRPQQGAIAAACADVLILSDEDPRGEEPMAILEEIARGAEAGTIGSEARKALLSRGVDLFLIPDRRLAIRRAFSLAKSGDIVLLLGKGHENSIIYRDGAIPWDELSAAREALGELGYSRGGSERPRSEIPHN